MIRTKIIPCLTFPFALAFTTPVHADLTPISDAEMSDVTGQAYISIDKYNHPDPEQSTYYTRINLGMTIETMLNADTLELGRYEREGEKPDSSDVLINNFGLGHIYDSQFYAANPDAIRPVKEDGSSYRDGEIVPFKIVDPFLEFARDSETGAVTGVRIGYGDSKGVFSGNVAFLSGNVNVDILDNGAGMRAAESEYGNIIDDLIVLLTPLLEGGQPIYTKAILVDEHGNPDPIRSEMIGVPNGEVFTLSGAGGFTRWSLKNLLGPLSSSDMDIPNCTFLNCPEGDIHIQVQDCLVLGIQSCFDLGIYNSFPIGEVTQGEDGNRYLTGSMPGMFMSFQTKDLEWLGDVKKANPEVADFIRATSGAFFNIPNHAVQVDLNEALNGTARVRGEYINRGNGLF